MATGYCRHCGAGRIAADAPVCREGGGWRTNPGFFTRAGVAAFRLVASLFLLVLLAACAFLVWLAARPDDEGGSLGFVVYLIALAPPTLGIAAALFRSLIRPYGREVSA